ncbi:MAG: hemerythrin domain-containing protein [Anaeromyxobacteraceae bacterium]
MSLDIPLLLEEHRTILAALDELRRSGPGRPAGRDALRALRDLLVGHLAREDALLYPRLRELARTRPHLRILLDGFERETVELGARVEAFFARLEHEGEALKLAGELGGLAADLRQRIHREEHVLYPELG